MYLSAIIWSNISEAYCGTNLKDWENIGFRYGFIYRIFIGKMTKMNKINLSLRFSVGVNWSDLYGLKPENPCVYYKKLWW